MGEPWLPLSYASFAPASRAGWFFIDDEKWMWIWSSCVCCDVKGRWIDMVEVGDEDCVSWCWNEFVWWWWKTYWRVLWWALFFAIDWRSWWVDDNGVNQSWWRKNRAKKSRGNYLYVLVLLWRKEMKTSMKRGIWRCAEWERFWRVGLFGVHMNWRCWFSKFCRGRKEKVMNEWPVGVLCGWAFWWERNGEDGVFFFFFWDMWWC